MCVLLGFLQKTWAIPIMNPLLWFMIMLLVETRVGLGHAGGSDYQIYTFLYVGTYVHTYVCCMYVCNTFTPQIKGTAQATFHI